ncbi:hypothetical protein DY000_02001734 [Brassica cretica]|uniref:Uncharacterized protein n=1 Tax=Brassica cretica TaxID=69181 RepID=A0ABQ7CIC3_BRACR|nr:hypothetical protein DY000_02001734 [Brassica cretica]
MAVDIPLLLPIDEFLVKRHDMWKHALRFIIRMTTGVVYSIAMHVLLITAYALLTFQIFYTKDFDLVLSFDATSLLSFIAYLLFGLFEIVGRTFLNDQVLFTFFGHVGHMVGLGSMFLLAYNKPYGFVNSKSGSHPNVSLRWLHNQPTCVSPQFFSLFFIGSLENDYKEVGAEGGDDEDDEVFKTKMLWPFFCIERLSRTNLKLEVNTVMFNAVLENACSEMGVRMCAMDSSSRNAGEMLDCFTSHLQQDSSRFHHNIAYRDYLCSLCT